MLLPPLKGKKVVVIGGGYTAFDIARLSAKKGANATIVYRGDSSRIKVKKEELSKAVGEGIKILTNCSLKEGKGEKLIFSCGEFSPDYLIPAIGFEVERETVYKLKGENTFLAGDVAKGMSSLVEASKSGREAAYRVLKKLGLLDRAWFTVDIYKPKPSKPSGKNLFVISESSLCQHCGIKVKS
jgi:NADPH-dependent glutamate synthase beta subunit-like oxidoreductase